jgi:hypothetical protein
MDANADGEEENDLFVDECKPLLTCHEAMVYLESAAIICKASLMYQRDLQMYTSNLFARHVKQTALDK